MVSAFFLRSYLGFMLFLTAFFASIDFYALTGFVSIPEKSTYKWIMAGIYILVSLIGYYGLYNMSKSWSSGVIDRSAVSSLLLGVFFTLIISKLIFCILLLGQDLVRLLFGGVAVVKSLANDSPVGDSGYIPPRRQFITLLSAGITAIPFAGLLHGITKGKYKFTVTDIPLRFPELPSSFDGFKIAQISDIHSGSWDSVEEVRKGIEMIQHQKPDMIVFTGDLVNRYKEEIDPYIDLFADLKAPFGKFAILGNHDYYGDRKDNSPQESEEYWSDFYGKFDKMGFRLLLNESIKINKDEDNFDLVGVENWGSSRHFPKKGDLNQALQSAGQDSFKILLSHDPTHWEEHVINHPQKIHLTLSGHTHGMQFGINLPGFQWSPVKFRYKHWMGLYEELEQKLYVNRGFGYLAFPGRVGMWPEISVFTLKTA